MIGTIHPNMVVFIFMKFITLCRVFGSAFDYKPVYLLIGAMFHNFALQIATHGHILLIDLILNFVHIDLYKLDKQFYI